MLGHYVIYKVYIARRFKEISEKKEKKRKEEEKASRHPIIFKDTRASSRASSCDYSLLVKYLQERKKKKEEYPKFRIDSNLKARQTLTYP